MFGEHARVADSADVQRLHPLGRWRNVHQFFKEA
jgi:hypothetical protein